MAKGGGKRSYTRDSNGRFASTPGGGKSAALKGGTLSKRSSLKGSRAKLAAKDKADPSIRNTLSTRAQKGAVTRGNKALRAAKAASQRTAVGRSKVGTVAKGKKSPVLKTTVLKPQAARVPAAQRPGSMTSTLRATMGALAKADARRIREIESITGQKVRPTAAGAKAGKEAGARVRATAKGGKVADTLRAGLRELAQSDARTMRGMAGIVRDATPKVAGGKGGKALKGAKKALPAAKAEPRQVATSKKSLTKNSRTTSTTPERKVVADQIRTLRKKLKQDQKDSEKAMKRRASLGIGASRAATTTANARWARRAEERDKTLDRIDMLRNRGKNLPKPTVAKPAAPKPPTRTKGSKATLPRTRGTVAKPKGLKPGALPVTKGAKPSVPGFTTKDFERRARRAFYNVKSTKVKDRALALYKELMDTDKTPAQVQKELTTGRRYSTIKNKPKPARKRLRQGEREHRDMLALANKLFR
jgi:hypothetical protein